jgi:hypothetical protein
MNAATETERKTNQRIERTHTKILISITILSPHPDRVSSISLKHLKWCVEFNEQLRVRTAERGFLGVGHAHHKMAAAIARDFRSYVCCRRKNELQMANGFSIAQHIQRTCVTTTSLVLIIAGTATLRHDPRLARRRRHSGILRQVVQRRRGRTALQRRVEFDDQRWVRRAERRLLGVGHAHDKEVFAAARDFRSCSSRPIEFGERLAHPKRTNTQTTRTCSLTRRFVVGVAAAAALGDDPRLGLVYSAHRSDKLFARLSGQAKEREHFVAFRPLLLLVGVRGGEFCTQRWRIVVGAVARLTGLLAPRLAEWTGVDAVETEKFEQLEHGLLVRRIVAGDRQRDTTSGALWFAECLQRHVKDVVEHLLCVQK